jgi:formate hydrogenlyase transcriptional activator
MEPVADEIKRLKGCINDLVSIVTIPAIWSGRESTQIVSTLLDALLGILRLDFAYARLKDPVSGTPIEMMRCAQSPNLTVPPQEIAQVLKGWLANSTSKLPSQARKNIGGELFSFAPMRLGLRDNLGVVIAGSRRADFPGETESLLLNVVANQAVIGLQEARELTVQKRVAVRLEEKVAQRTRELACLVDNVPGLVAIMAADGAVEFINERVREYFGRTLTQFKEWAISDVVHPHDLSYAVATWRGSTDAGQPYDFDLRLRRHDGVYRWLHASGLPIRDSDGRIFRWYVLLTDIHERKTAEEKLRQRAMEQASVIDTIPGLIMTATAEGDVEFVNKGALEYFGKALEVLKGWTVSDSVHPEDLAYVLPEWRRCVETGERYDLDHRCRRVDGEYRWFHSSALPLQDADGRLARWYVLLTDIHERKVAEEKLRQDEKELRQITDAIPDSIHVLAPDGTILHVNQAALDYSGLSLDDAQNADYRSRFFHPEDVQRLGEEWGAALGRAVPFERELRALRKDGKYRWYLVRYNPLQDEDGRIIRWYATATDIEDRKQAEDRTSNENLALREEITRSSMFEEIVGSSMPLRKVLDQVAKVAPTDSTVLISGETGTGKELIARAIHKLSSRSARAFISVNCGAIPQSLVTSELFGHEKGAFTGAMHRRAGRFEAADGGTIFLDEIGELPLETQVALLRVLQEREFERIGSSERLKVDVRVLAATNRDLKRAVDTGTFRQDLFYRLNVFPIDIPPLRERAGDILLLAEYTINRYAKKLGKRFSSIASDTVDLLNKYHWPGNIRELQNVIERGVVLCEGSTFSVDESWLRRGPSSTARPGVTLGATSAGSEREMIEAALAESRGQVSGASGAAAKLGISRQALELRILRFGINKHRFKT